MYDPKIGEVPTGSRYDRKVSVAGGGQRKKRGGEESNLARAETISTFRGYLRIMDTLSVNEIARPSVAGVMVPITRRECLNAIRYLEDPRSEPYEWDDDFERGPKGGDGYFPYKRKGRLTGQWKVEVAIRGRTIYGGLWPSAMDARVKAERLRQKHGQRAIREFCKRGHPQVPENRTAYERRGPNYSRCRECERYWWTEGNARRAARRKGATSNGSVSPHDKP